MPILLVRHANAGSRSDWDGTDRDRRLSSKGRKQAEGLVSLADVYSPKRLLSSPFTRCTQTLAPMAAALDLPVESTDALAEGRGIDALHLVRSLVGEDAALCTHGDVIPEILMALADEDLLVLGPRPRQAKGSVWVLEASDQRFVQATYIPPSL